MLGESVLAKMIRTVLHSVFETLSDMISYSELKFYRLVRAFFAFWSSCIETASNIGSQNDDGKKEQFHKKSKEYEKFYNIFLAEFLEFSRQALHLDHRWASIIQYLVSIWGKYSGAEIDAHHIISAMASDDQSRIFEEVDALIPRCSQGRRESYIKGSLSMVTQSSVPNMTKLIHDFRQKLKRSLK